MATDTQPTASITPRLDLYRLDLGQFDTMTRAGVFREDDRVELLGGLLVRRMTKLSPHTFVLNRVFSRLSRIIPAPWWVAKEDPIELGPYWRPEPDVSILLGPDDRYQNHAPTVADVAFLVEVADATYRTDRGAKLRGYASTRVPEYWIVNLNARRIEVYRDPTGNGKSASYRTTAIFGVGDSIPVVIDGVEIGGVDVSEIMPQKAEI